MLQTSWDRMVSRRMYLTGGIGFFQLLKDLDEIMNWTLVCLGNLRSISESLLEP